MKTEKTVTESLSELFEVAESFVKIMESSKIVNHFLISSKDGQPSIISELNIKFYQPSEEIVYCLKTKYTFIEIGQIKIGCYGCVNYKFTLTSKDIDIITKEAKKVYDLFKTYSFGSMYERRMIEIKNDIKKTNNKLRHLKIEYKKNESLKNSLN